MTYEQELTEYNQNRSKFHHIKPYLYTDIFPYKVRLWIVYGQLVVPTLKEAVEIRDK